jgi:transposase
MKGELSEMNATTIGLDIAKNVFQVHAVDANGEVVIRRQLRRTHVIAFFKKLPACLVGMEACTTSHYWAREIAKLGHRVRLMPPAYVKPYVKRNKNDAADAGAICEAVTQPSMRFVVIKSEEQQSALMLHRTRELLVRQRTMLVNAIRGHMAELGIVARAGVANVTALLAVIADPQDTRLALDARTCLQGLAVQLLSVDQEILAAERRIHAHHQSNPISQRLATTPGIGPIIATALAASVTDPRIFPSGRGLAAWIGLVPRQASTGGKQRLGRISKQGDPYLRWLLVAGSMSVIRQAKRRGTSTLPWLDQLIANKPTKVAAVALANKMARIAWVLLMRGGSYRKPAGAQA